MLAIRSMIDTFAHFAAFRCISPCHGAVKPSILSNPDRFLGRFCLPARVFDPGWRADRCQLSTAMLHGPIARGNSEQHSSYPAANWGLVAVLRAAIGSLIVFS